MLRRLVGLVCVVTIVAGAFVAARAFVAYRDALNAPLALPSSPFRYEIRPGATLTEVVAGLSAAGVLADRRALLWYARWQGVAGRIKAGEYAIESGTTAVELLELFVAGRTSQYSITLVEGWSFAQVMKAIAANEQLKHTLSDADGAQVMAALGRAGDHPEGRFFADTYSFPKGSTDVELLTRAMQAMDAQLQQRWDNRDEGLPFQHPYEALILASIVEKETGRAAERSLIAGVFIERLERDMRLETDPTVIYGMGALFDGNLRRKDLRADTPYNTYVHKGLPPTPIAMPGAAALEAVMHPQRDGSIFFVAKGDGSHHFSATYEEHKQAVAKYQLGR